MTRPMTIAEKILAKHAGLEEVKSGQLISAKLDITLANDITGPVAIKEFKKILYKIYRLEKKAKKLSENEYFSSNPFAFKKEKTYVWIDKVDDYNHCNINFEREY